MHSARNSGRLAAPSDEGTAHNAGKMESRGGRPSIRRLRILWHKVPDRFAEAPVLGVSRQSLFASGLLVAVSPVRQHLLIDVKKT